MRSRCATWSVRRWPRFGNGPNFPAAKTNTGQCTHRLRISLTATCRVTESHSVDTSLETVDRTVRPDSCQPLAVQRGSTWCGRQRPDGMTVDFIATPQLLAQLDAWQARGVVPRPVQLWSSGLRHCRFGNLAYPRSLVIQVAPFSTASAAW